MAAFANYVEVMTPMLIDDLVSDPRRHIALQNVHNFRDLGGYPASGGKRTKWRNLFRADGLYRLNEHDLELVRELQLRSVIDLRTERERTERGVFPVQHMPLQTHHFSIVDVTWSDGDPPQIEDAIEFLVWGYREMLDIGAPRFAGALELLSQQDVLPAVFHCAAGKDRTGLLAALLLAGIGVSDDVICADYGLTQQAMIRTIAWAEMHMPEMARRYAEINPVFLAADPKAMEIILAELHANYGSVSEYVKHIGVSEQTILRLKHALLEN